MNPISPYHQVVFSTDSTGSSGSFESKSSISRSPTDRQKLIQDLFGVPGDKPRASSGLSSLSLMLSGAQKVSPDTPTLPFLAKDLLNPEAYEKFLRTADRLIRLSENRSNQPEDLKAAHDMCHELWKTNGLLNQNALLKAIVEKKFPERTDLLELFNKSLPVHSLTGCTSPFTTPTEVALAHDYVKTTGKPLNIAFGDVANVGATNDLNDRLIIESKLPIDDICKELKITPKASDKDPKKQKMITRKLTDWYVRIIMGTIREILEKAFNGKVMLLGMGGDEIFAVSPGATAKEVSKVIEKQVMPELARIIKELGLHKHPHRKEGKAPGLGISFGGVRSLNESNLTHGILSRKSFSNIKVPQELLASDNEEQPSLSKILDTLKKEYAEYEPITISDKDLENIVVVHGEPDLKDPKSIIEQQLFTMVNEAGIQDIKALPSYVKAQGLEPSNYRIGVIQLNNIAILNDQVSHTTTNEILRRFAEALRLTTPDGKPIEVFRVNAGKLVCVIPTIATKYMQPILKSLRTAADNVVKQFNTETVDIKDPQSKQFITKTIGSLVSDETKEQGLSVKLPEDLKIVMSHGLDHIDSMLEKN